jgi:hypothetical protein
MLLVLFIVADWTENLVQLTQLKKWPNVEEQWIEVASYSTIVKLWASLVSYIGLLVAIAVLICRGRHKIIGIDGEALR